MSHTSNEGAKIITRSTIVEVALEEVFALQQQDLEEEFISISKRNMLAQQDAQHPYFLFQGEVYPPRKSKTPVQTISLHSDLYSTMVKLTNKDLDFESIILKNYIVNAIDLAKSVVDLKKLLHPMLHTLIINKFSGYKHELLLPPKSPRDILSEDTLNSFTQFHAEPIANLKELMISNFLCKGV